MIRRIIWPKLQDDEPPSPFVTGQMIRPLRVTLHTESFCNLTAEEARAIDTLKNFSHHNLLHAIDTDSGDLPQLFIGAFDAANDHTEIELLGKCGNTKTLIWNTKELPYLAKKLAGAQDLTDPLAESMLRDILVARAHTAIGNSILVTLSDGLLGNTDKKFIRDANPSTPVQTVKLLGLLLRAHEDYTIDMCEYGVHALDRGMFYWVLARHRLPRLWLYFSACVHSDKSRGDGILGLGASVLNRCARALEARDFIGHQFHCPQANNTRDRIMYHFDYLMMLLSGIFDAQSLVARRSYGIKKPSDRNSNFRHQAFQHALDKAGASKLLAIVKDTRFLDLLSIIGELRNTIHGAGLHSTAYRSVGRDEDSYLVLGDSHSQAIWSAAESYSSPDQWGLIQSHERLLEPYTFSVTAVRECFRMTNMIAHATDLRRLFTTGPAPAMARRPPNSGGFEKWTRKRVHILG